jgi:hypothetical protein
MALNGRVRVELEIGELVLVGIPANSYGISPAFQRELARLIEDRAAFSEPRSPDHNAQVECVLPHGSSIDAMGGAIARAVYGAISP